MIKSMLHLRQPSGADLQYMEDLLNKIEAAKMPAPSPIQYA